MIQIAPSMIWSRYHNESKTSNYIYIWGGEVWVHLLEGQGSRARAILVLRECIWKAPAVSLVPSARNDISSLGSPPRQVDKSPGSMVPPWVTVSCFLARNRETKLKPTTFSSLLYLLLPLFPSSPLLLLMGFSIFCMYYPFISICIESMLVHVRTTLCFFLVNQEAPMVFLSSTKQRTLLCYRCMLLDSDSWSLVEANILHFLTDTGSNC